MSEVDAWLFAAELFDGQPTPETAFGLCDLIQFFHNDGLISTATRDKMKSRIGQYVDCSWEWAYSKDNGFAWWTNDDRPVARKARSMAALFLMYEAKAGGRLGEPCEI